MSDEATDGRTGVVSVPDTPNLPEQPSSPVAPAAPPNPTIADISKYEADKAERQLKHWVIKLIVSVVALMFSLVCAAVIWTSIVKPQNSTDTGLIKHFLETLLEMLKVMKT